MLRSTSATTCLSALPSTFATLKNRQESEDEDPFDGLDESKLEGAMDSLMRELGGVDEEDPRAMGRMMRRFGELTGLEMGGRLEEMVQRIEAGEDPDGLEAELGDDLGDDVSMEDFFKLKKALGGDRRPRRPKVDEDLYFL